MSQSLVDDFPIDPLTTSGDELADILNRFEQAVNSSNSGAAAPASTAAGMWWLDTSGAAPILKIRNAANSGWIAVMTMSGGGGITSLFADGTVAAPSIAFASEPGLGFWKTTTSRIALAAAGASVFAINGSNVAGTGVGIFPRSAGTTSINMYNAPENAANTSALTIGVGAAAITFGGSKAGTGALLPFSFTGGPRYTFDAEVHANGGGGGFALDGNWPSGANFAVNCLSANPSWGILRLQAWHVSNQWAGWRFTADGSNTSSVDFKVHAASAEVTLNGPNTLVTATRFAGKADNAGYADGAGYANNSGAISGVGLGGLVRGDICDYVGFVAQGQQPYFRRSTDGGTYRVATLQNIGARQTFDGEIGVSGRLYATGDIVNQGTHSWRWFWNGDAGDNHLYAFVDGANQGWATLNSDERIKQDIAPLPMNFDGYMAIAPIQFRFRDLGIWKTGDIQHGFSAQQLLTCMPKAVVGDVTAMQEDHPDLPQPANVDDRVILAQTVLMVQAAHRRIAQLESQLLH